MSLIHISDLSFGYPGRSIFEKLNFRILPGDRLGLVGPNGAGKSTLLRLLTGKLTPDGGNVIRSKGATIGYLRQSQELGEKGTVFDALLEPFAELLALRAECERLEQALEQHSTTAPSLSDPAASSLLDQDATGPTVVQHGTSLASLLRRYGEVQELLRLRDGYRVEANARAAAMEVGLLEEDLERPVSSLSGGQRGRLELAKVLAERADLLLLDEPTNHLDIAAVERLETYLQGYTGAFVLVSHDRYFLRATCRDIVEVEGSSMVRFSGGYDRYAEERVARLARLAEAFERQQESIAKTEDFIRRNLAGQNTKQAKSRRKMLDKVERLERPQDHFAQASRIGLVLSAGDHKGGKEALRIDRLSVGYPDAQLLITELSATLYRGDRVAIVGPNGAGKTTLLKTLMERLPARKGRVVRGYQVEMGYYDQSLGDLDEGRTLIGEIRSIRGDWTNDTARTFLARFRFYGDETGRKVKGLSGGERSRLALAKLMLDPKNLLALDEPTNHLDIPAREVLEAALEEYEGTLLIVSHDRYFLDRVANKVLHIADGKATLYNGNYTEFREGMKAEAAKAATRASTASSGSAPVATGRPAAPPSEPSDGGAGATGTAQRSRQEAKAAERERRKLERELATVEEQIAELEAKLATLRAALANAHGEDWHRLHALVDEERTLSEALVAAMASWEKLGEQLAS